ncbi:Ankyrin repeat-containing domain protein [Moelleriella libera RCEF 2490]|uniref:Ankyrin repeat-containing domain protein n=1 Tax=Moelleriella libera RCEF 2490 TaxID=1081109 RepID=A0A162IF65_9HYPO|nr:Ankyrin repeat-containing domain protein [Moelleriella libera RCEF 2490]
MRFGSSLRLRRVPAWAESYIDYNRLNVLVDAQSPIQVSRILDKAAVKYTTAKVTSVSTNFKNARKEGPGYQQRLLFSIAATEAVWVRPHFELFLREIIGYLHRDDAGELEQALRRQFPNSDEAQSALVCLIHVATVYRSSSYQGNILKRLRSTPARWSSLAPSDYLQRIIQHVGRADPLLDSPAARTFGQILELLQSTQIHLLQGENTLGRLPLHYAAILGLSGVCRKILAVGQESAAASPQSNLLIARDKPGLTPSAYAVRRGHTSVVAILLAVYEPPNCPMESHSMDTRDFLNTAIASRYLDIARLLIDKGLGVLFVGKSDRTMLHTVAEQGCAEMVKDIIALGVDVNVWEKVRGWTALTTASVQGHYAIVEVLVESGARARVPDHRGWLAKDYAAYRGHMRVVEAIKFDGSSRLQPKPGRRLGAVNILPERSPSESVIFVHLGTLDLSKMMTSPVDMTPYRKCVSPLQVHDTSLELSISLAGSN